MSRQNSSKTVKIQTDEIIIHFEKKKNIAIKWGYDSCFWKIILNHLKIISEASECDHPVETKSKSMWIKISETFKKSYFEKEIREQRKEKNNSDSNALMIIVCVFKKKKKCTREYHADLKIDYL